jgi:hypothetical protein
MRQKEVQESSDGGRGGKNELSQMHDSVFPIHKMKMASLKNQFSALWYFNPFSGVIQQTFICSV